MEIAQQIGYVVPRVDASTAKTLHPLLCSMVLRYFRSVINHGKRTLGEGTLAISDSLDGPMNVVGDITSLARVDNATLESWCHFSELYYVLMAWRY